MSLPHSGVPAPIEVLIVEDHPFFREGLIAWLSRYPIFHCCGVTDSATTARVMVEALRPNLMLLDLQLREGNGLELLQQLKSAPVKPRVIVMSQKDQRIYAERALVAGAMGYVLKDEAMDTLAGAIQTVLHGRIHLSPDMQRRIFKTRTLVAEAPADPLRELFNRELQVLEYLGQGLTLKEIAQTLGLSLKTVDSYRESLKKKLGVPDSTTLVRMATLWQSDGRWVSGEPQM